MRYLILIILSIVWILLLIGKVDGEALTLIIGFFWIGIALGENINK